MPLEIDVPFSVDRASLDALGTALALGTGALGTGPDLDAAPADIDWAGLEKTARLGKLLTIARRGFLRWGVQPSAEFSNAAAAFRRQALSVNTANLSTLSRLVPVLEDAGLPFVLFKGPLHQHMAHGDYFMRPSTDIDLLVAEGRFDRASDILRRFGYQLPEECMSPWWRHFLGEQHFFSARRGDATVDLHHRVQQPGCPAPRHIDGFIADARSAPLGRITVPVMSRVNAALISAISLVKAIIRYEPSGIYLCDLSAMLAAMPVEERRELAERARRQGLTNTLRFAIRSARRFGMFPDLEGLPGLPERSCVRDGELGATVLTPWDRTILRPRLRSFMWELCDSSGPAGKAGAFAAVALNQAAAKACKKWYHGRPAPQRKVLAVA